MSEATTAAGGGGGAGGGCLHCSLITSSMSSSDSERGKEEMVDMFPVTAFLLPGLYLVVLSVRWTTVSVSGWLQEARYQSYHLAGLPPPPPPTALTGTPRQSAPLSLVKLRPNCLLIGWIMMFLCQLSYAIKTQLKAPKRTKSLCLDSIWAVSMHT